MINHAMIPLPNGMFHMRVLPADNGYILISSDGVSPESEKVEVCFNINDLMVRIRNKVNQGRQTPDESVLQTLGERHIAEWKDDPNYRGDLTRHL